MSPDPKIGFRLGKAFRQSLKKSGPIYEWQPGA